MMEKPEKVKGEEKKSSGPRASRLQHRGQIPTSSLGTSKTIMTITAPSAWETSSHLG